MLTRAEREILSRIRVLWRQIQRFKRGSEHTQAYQQLAAKIRAEVETLKQLKKED